MNYNDEEFTMNQLLKHLFREEQAEPVCPNCGLALSEALHIGKFGCHTCYATFSDYVPQIVERVQAGNQKHTGQAPLKSAEKIKLKKQIEALEAKLEGLVAEQAFEEAVLVRDEIKALRQRGDSDAG